MFCCQAGCCPCLVCWPVLRVRGSCALLSAPCPHPEWLAVAAGHWVWQGVALGWAHWWTAALRAPVSRWWHSYTSNRCDVVSWAPGLVGSTHTYFRSLRSRTLRAGTAAAVETSSYAVSSFAVELSWQVSSTCQQLQPQTHLTLHQQLLPDSVHTCHQLLTLLLCNIGTSTCTAVL